MSLNVKMTWRFNFYAYERPFMHGLYYICERKFYARAHVKITRRWKSTLTPTTMTQNCFDQYPQLILPITCLTFLIWDKIVNGVLISYRRSGENFIKYQENSSSVMMSAILMITKFYKALILQREIWCCRSLLGLKGLNLWFSSCPIQPRNPCFGLQLCTRIWGSTLDGLWKSHRRIGKSCWGEI